MARKTEENLTEMFKQHSKTIEKQLESYVKKMELQMRALQPTLAVQHQLLQENQIIMKEQQTQINKLHSDNQDLRVRVQSLQADISILRSQPLRSNIEEESSCFGDLYNTCLKGPLRKVFTENCHPALVIFLEKTPFQL